MNPLIEQLGWVLVHSLWQFALVAMLAGVIVRAMRRSSSALRYGVLVTAMAVSVSAPIASWMLMPSDSPTDHLANRAASVPGHESIAATSPGADDTWLASEPSIAGDAVIEGPISDLVPTSVASELLPATSPLSVGNTQPTLSWSVRAKTVLQPWFAWIVAGWSLGVVLCSARPLFGWHTLRRLKRVGVSPVSDEVLASLHRASERLGLRGSVQLLQSTLAQVPIVVGYFRPVILLPISLMTSIPAAQLEAILTHELAHIQRHDFIVNLLQTLVETLFFYHPAVWWLSRQIRVEREHCCDDLVVKLLGNRVEYGRALVAIEQLRGRNSVLALGAADGSLLARVRRIVGFNSTGNVASAVERWPAALLGLALIAATFLLTLNWNLLQPEHKMEVKVSVESLPVEPAAEISADNAAGAAADDDGHTLIVMFDKDAKCNGIQRVRSEEKEKPVETAILIQVYPPPVVGDFSKVDDPDMLLDQLANSQVPSLAPISGGDYFHQPGAPPQAHDVSLWETQYTGDDKLDPRIRRLIELGDRAVPRVHQRLNGLTVSDLLATHLTIVLRSAGTTESVPVLIKLMKTAPTETIDGTQSIDVFQNSFQASVTQIAVTSALWKLTGRKHLFTSDQWEKWWQSVKPDFFAPLERTRPEFVSRVTPERVEALVGDLATNELAARERLIALGPTAVSHLLKVLSVPEALRDPASPSAAAAIRLAWVIDELGVTEKLSAKLRRDYFTHRFSDEDTYAGMYPIDEDAFGRALSYCSFADFCSIYMEAESRGNVPAHMTHIKWPYNIYSAYCRRFSKIAPLDTGGRTDVPHWKKVVPAENPADEIGNAVPILLTALKDERAERRISASKLAAAIGFCTTAMPETLIVALRNEWLAEADEKVRPEIGFAMCRFQTPFVVKEISQGLLSDRPEIVSDCAGLMDWIPIEFNDETRAAFDRLVELTRHENDRVRRSATRSLASKAPQLLGPEFVRLCTDKVKDIREACTLALRSNPDSKHADILFKLADDAEQTIRESAFSSIANLNHPPSMKRLLPHLRDKNVYGYAISALASMGGKDAIPLMMSELEAGNDVGGMVYQHLSRLTGEGFEEQPELWLAWWKKNKPAPVPDKNSTANAPADDLEFLKPYPKLHGLSLDMTEPQFLEIVKQQELKTKRNGEGKYPRYELPLGDGHTLIVMFDKDAKCSGIQRVRGEEEAELTFPADDLYTKEERRPAGAFRLDHGTGRLLPLPADQLPPAAPGEKPANAGVRAIPPLLEFRFAAQRADSQVEPRVPGDYEQRDYSGNSVIGRMVAKDRGFIWVPVAGANDRVAALPVERLRGGQVREALLADTPEHAMAWNGKWSIADCRVFPDPNNLDRSIITLKLNEAGGDALRALTKSHFNQPLAILVNNEIITAPIVREEFGRDIAITGKFTREQAEKLVAVLAPRPQADSDLLAKYGDQLVVSWVRHGNAGSPDEGFLIAVLKDGTVIAAGDSNRNRECQIKLTAAQIDQLLKELDEDDRYFELIPDGEHIIEPGQPYNSWDHGVSWIRIRRGKKELHIGLTGGVIAGQGEHTHGVSTCYNVMARLNPLINLTRAGGWEEIERLLPVANAALKQAFPDLPPIALTDFFSSERFQYPARSIYFRKTGPDGGKKFGVELERRDDGTVNPISVWNGGDIRDVEKPLVVRGLDLAKVPFTQEWKEMEKLRVLTNSGYTFKPEYAAYEVAPETWACYLPKEDKFFIEVGNNQRRRKLYGPIAGSPLKVLNPPPVAAKTDNAAATANQQRDVSLADVVRVFNDENQQLRQGLNQPALTEDEVIAAIKHEKWQLEDPPLNEQEIAAFKAVAESKRLPEYAHLDLETEDETETFVWKKLWRVQLMLPAIGHDGHVGLTIRDTRVAEEKIESTQVAWGKPDAEGLTLGIYLSPRKAQYAIGDRVRLRFLVRNGGQQKVKTKWLGISVPMPDDFTVTDQTGAKVAVNIGHENWDSPWTTVLKNGTLGVGDVHGMTVPYEISIGGDGSKNSFIGRVIDARPGQKLLFKVRERNGSARERKEGEAEPESGSIAFEVVEAVRGPVAPQLGAVPKSDSNEKDAPVPDPKIDPNGEIHGVLLGMNNEPVVGATIACGAVINDSLKGGGANAVTDAKGRYRLKVPSPGIYNVWLKKHDDAYWTAAADDGLFVEAGKVTTSKMQLIRGTMIAGSLVDADDKPMSGLSIYCYSLARPQSGATVQSELTDEKGEFKFWLVPGRAYVYAVENDRVRVAASIEVPRNGRPEPIEPLKLVLKHDVIPFGGDSWLQQSSPGTQIVRHENAKDVTGTVVDTDGQPIAGAKVFRYDGPIVTTNDRGEFTVSADNGTQFILHAALPGYRVWFGTPTAGDVLTIVLEKKEESSSLTTRSQAPPGNASPEAPPRVPSIAPSQAEPGNAKKERLPLEVRLVGGPKSEPLPNVKVEFTSGGSDMKSFGTFTTDDAGWLKASLPVGFYYLHLTSDKELPYLPVEYLWNKESRGPRPDLSLSVTKNGAEKWLAGKKRDEGYEPPAEPNNLPRITYKLLPACELTLRAVDADTGKGLPGVEFYEENAVGEDWAHAICGQNIRSKSSWDREPVAAAANHTDLDGNFRRFVSANAGFTYGYWKPPAGYEAVSPGEVEGDIRYGQLRAEHIFKFRRIR